MARLVDCCPSSDDDLPDLKKLLRRPSTRTTKESGAPVKPEAKSLAPKSTSKSGTRRVRRLDSSDQAIANPLFQKWNSEELGSSQSVEEKPRESKHRVRQVSREAQKKSPASQSDSEDDEPRLRVRGTRKRQQLIIDDSDEDCASEDDDTLLTRIRNLRGEKPATAVGTEKNTNAQSSKPEASGKSRALKQVNGSDSGSNLETTHDDSRAEDPSIYLTAEEEESSEFGDDSELDSEFENSPVQHKRALGSRPATGQARAPSGTRKISSTGEIPPLVPRSIGSRNVSVGSQKGNITLGDEAVPTKKGIVSKKPVLEHKESGSSSRSTVTSTAAGLVDSLSKLRLELEDFSDEESKVSKQDQFATPPSTPPKPKGLKSPNKRQAIPQTPHHHKADAFWNQDLVNDWNDNHSPRKLVLPPVNKSPAKSSPKKAPKKETKKSFDARKQALAERFLVELDREITQGKIAELAESTGGVKLVWTKTLNTTAGRASWRRETIRTKKADGTQLSAQYKHHASIELAEKVIDEEHRLLNVLAHEFCHLANFMVSGITNNPHGKEFKVWAAKCSRAFGHRDIEVTTKHSYDIDFKYVWECEACGSEFKRHSKSIDPQRHRCGSCKGFLKQTKPVPRGGGAGAKPSRYQVFVKEQMAVVRAENPGSPQKNLMKLVAEKWAKQEGSNKTEKRGKAGIDNVLERMVDLTLEEDV